MVGRADGVREVENGRYPCIESLEHASEVAYLNVLGAVDRRALKSDTAEVVLQHRICCHAA